VGTRDRAFRSTPGPWPSRLARASAAVTSTALPGSVSATWPKSVRSTTTSTTGRGRRGRHCRDGPDRVRAVPVPGVPVLWLRTITAAARAGVAEGCSAAADRRLLVLDEGDRPTAGGPLQRRDAARRGRHGIGVTNAAYRTTPGSGDLRRADFAGSLERLEELARTLAPRAIGFVGKEAYRGVFGERPELGPQERRLGETALLVLPSTSPANAAVPYAERLRWFQAFFAMLSANRPRTNSQPSS
jgi:G:T/U-mismatch repair DNA glycosylase